MVWSLCFRDVDGSYGVYLRLIEAVSHRSTGILVDFWPRLGAQARIYRATGSRPAIRYWRFAWSWRVPETAPFTWWWTIPRRVNG